MKFLDQFNVLLFDMNGTFMFGHDLFGPEQDYYASYKRCGGGRLSRAEFEAILLPSVAALLQMYDDPLRYNDFPALSEVFLQHGAAAEDLTVLERVVAAHETGYAPAEHAQFLGEVALTHQLGVVSNIFAHPSTWLATNVSASVFELFKVLVFSSQGRSIKPSVAMFQRALSQFSNGSSILFIGDSLERDIIPAKALGLSTVWIAPEGSVHAAADLVVESLPELRDVS